MKIFRAISGFLFFGCIVVLTSCATHSKPANMDTGARTDVPVQNIPAVVVSEALGKTIIDMPLDANTQIYADHDADKNIKVLFTPPVTDFELPLNVTELVSDIQKEMDGDKVTALNIFLKENSKFLLSKQSETLGRLMLVSDETSTPQLPSNYILDFRG